MGQTRGWGGMNIISIPILIPSQNGFSSLKAKRIRMDTHGSGSHSHAYC